MDDVFPDNESSPSLEPAPLMIMDFIMPPPPRQIIPTQIPSLTAAAAGGRGYLVHCHNVINDQQH